MKYRVSVYPGGEFEFRKLDPASGYLSIYDEAHIQFNVTHRLTLDCSDGIHNYIVNTIDINILSKELLIYEIDEKQLALLILMIS